MGIIIDLILLAIILINVLIGYKRGLIKVAFNVFAFIIALIVTLILVRPVSYLIINNTQMDENIKQIIIKNNELENEEQISDNNENSGKNIDKEDSTFIKKYIQKTIKEKTDNAKSKAIETVADSISKKVIEIGVSIILFIIIRIIIIFLSFISDIISKFPIIKQLNEIGGIVYGLLKAIIIIYSIITIVFIVSSIKGEGPVGNAIEKSFITKYLYNNNIIVNYCLLDKNLL